MPGETETLCGIYSVVLFGAALPGIGFFLCESVRVP